MSQIVLASSSSARRQMLTAAGLRFEVAPAEVDEGALKAREQAEGRSTRELAGVLAEAKALDVSRRLASDALVIGADQTLDCEGRAFDKATTLEDLREHLAFLRGRVHALHASVAVARGAEILWSHTETTRLTMRAFSDPFLDGYVARHGKEVMSSLGGYWFEGEGAQLFERVEGDYFTILGLPLLPLLNFLRTAGALPS